MKSKLSDLRKKVITCTKCSLDLPSNIGYGLEEKPDVLFVGTAPKLNTDGSFRLGRGYSLFVDLLEEVGIDNYFFDNIVRCQLPGDRAPFNYEIENCSGYTQQLILELKPRLIVAVGKTAWKLLEPIADCQIMHPTAAFYNGARREELREQLIDLKEAIERRRRK